MKGYKSVGLHRQKSMKSQNQKAERFWKEKRVKEKKTEVKNTGYERKSL